MNPMKPTIPRTLGQSLNVTHPNQAAHSDRPLRDLIDDATYKRFKEEEAFYHKVAEFLNKDNYMTETEFSKYIPLYQKSVLNEIINGDVRELDENSDIVKMITELSTELWQKINPQRPIHITNDEGKVVATLPPLMRKLTLPKNYDSAFFGDDILAFNILGTDDSNVTNNNKARELSAIIAEKIKVAQFDQRSTRAQDTADYTYMADRFNLQKLMERGQPIPKDILLKYFPELANSPDLDRFVNGTSDGNTANAASSTSQPDTHKTSQTVDDGWDDDDLFD